MAVPLFWGPKRKEQLEPVAGAGRVIAQNFRPGVDKGESGATTALGLRGTCLRPRVKRKSRIDHRHAYSGWFSGKRQFDLILLGQAAMVVEIGDEFLDDDAKPRQILVGKAERPAEAARRLDGIDDRFPAPKAPGERGGI